MKRLRVLSLGEFPPASDEIGHRDILAGSDIDYRVAIQHAYVPRHLAADWIASALCYGSVGQTKGDVAELVDFARSADVIQVAPGIGQPWADRDAPPKPELNPPWIRFFGIDWERITAHARARVAYIHGSLNTAVHTAAYARMYREAGWTLAASTLDYSCWMDAFYMPPTIDAEIQAAGRAAPRGEYDPLIIAHTPTNPIVCNTKEIRDLTAQLGVPLSFATRAPHRVALRAKLRACVGFDHLRGSFSVNTIENTSLGLAALFGLRKDCAQYFARNGYAACPGQRIESVNDLHDAIVALRDDPPLTRVLQESWYSWAHRNFSAQAMRPRLEVFYHSLVENHA
jgi:hypothetical protein